MSECCLKPGEIQKQQQVTKRFYGVFICQFNHFLVSKKTEAPVGLVCKVPP
jgi:hypothetical protein